tara:strand:- start:1515 stop:3611 length:2097 start_codon:yes stop_codon:yes gene_type:complete
MANDSLKYAIAGLGELADLYTKSKALDLAQQQFLIQREESAADRALKVRQIDLTEAKMESNESLAQLQLFISERDRLYNEQRVQEQVLQKRYNVSPEYKTSAFEDIQGMLTGSMDDNIGVVNNQIGSIQNNLTDLSRQIGSLQAQEQWFAAEKSKYVGLNKVLQEHEFPSMIEAAKSLDQFKGQDLAGVRTAYAEEMPSWRRTMLAEGMSTKLKSEHDKYATVQYSALQKFTSDEKFDWNKQFGSEEMANAAKSATNVTDYKAFLNRINSPGNEALRNVLETHGAFGPMLGNIEANAARVYELDAELMGETIPKGSVRSNVLDDFTAIMSITDPATNDKATLYEAYDNFVKSRGIFDQKRLDQIFNVLEEHTGKDEEEDFRTWMTNPEALIKPDPLSVIENISEVSSLDQLVAEYETSKTEQKEIKSAGQSKKQWINTADTKFREMYQKSPSELRNILDNIYSPIQDPGVVYPGGGMPVMKDKGVGVKKISKEQWQDLDNHVARTVSAMLMQPDPDAVDYLAYFGGSLLSADMETSVLKGGKSARNLLESYAEYKAHVQDEFEFSPEIKKLMEKHSIPTPSPLTKLASIAKDTSTTRQSMPPAGSQEVDIDSGFGDFYNMDPALVDRALDKIVYDPNTLQIYSDEDLGVAQIYNTPDWYDYWNEQTGGQGFPLMQNEGVVEAWTGSDLGWGRDIFSEE